MKINATQSIEVDVSVSECLRVLKSAEGKNLPVSDLLSLLLLKFKNENNISKEWYFVDYGNGYSWFTEEGYGHYEREIVHRSLNEKELRFVQIMQELEEILR